MITASNELRNYLKLFNTQTDACQKLGIDEATLSKMMRGQYNVSSKVIAKVLNTSGFSFETAFEVKK